jgi:hypothetical protein
LEIQFTHLIEQERRCEAELAAVHTRMVPLQARREALAAENARQAAAPTCRRRMDAGFSNGENLTALLELGYEIETKVGNPAVVAALQQRVPPTAPWTRVGRNAEMVGWPEYYLPTCPYPVMVALERFYTPQGLK